MRRDGQITVFLSMCLVCVAALICVMLESARLAGDRKSTRLNSSHIH